MGCLKLTYRTDYTALKAVQSGLYGSGKTGAGSYRFGFNGMYKDNELKGIGNSYDFGARIYDSRIGRWLSLDPLAAKYPDLSPYAFVANNPIRLIDPDGRDIKDALLKGTPYETVFKKVTDLDVMKEYFAPFQKSTKVNYTLEYNPTPQYPRSAGQTYDAKRGSSKTNYNSIVGGTGISVGGGYKYTLSEIGRATTVIHETFHAVIFKQINDGGIKKKTLRGDDQEHNYLAKNFQPKILAALEEYNSKNELGISSEGLKALSWVGLEGTDAYNEEYKTEEAKGEQQKTASALIYNIEQEQPENNSNGKTD
jgi:RHS repeat-associated protein